MKRQFAVSLLSSVLACVVLLLLVAGVGAQGQPEGSPQPIDPAAPNGTPISGTFTYQGQLKSSGSAVTNACDFQFGLWDAASGGLQVGVTQTLTTVAVTNGLFTVPLNFGANAFTDDARWLAIAVRCPAGGGNYAPLNPRQAVTPAPYAAYASGNWGLTGNRGTGASNFLGTTDNTKLTLVVSNTAALRLIPNANAPILIGGYAGNAVNGMGYGSVIAGGGSGAWGANIISGTSVVYATISGGYNNQISGTAYRSAIGGGSNNQIGGTSSYSAISGGYQNQISEIANHSAIGGGYQNQISGSAWQSVIGGGYNNQISEIANHSAIGGGWANQISGTAYESVIGGGYNNQISEIANHSAIGGGGGNQISGSAFGSAIGSGESNQISEGAGGSAIGSGHTNQISGHAGNSAIGSGDQNQISGVAELSAIGSGQSNQISGGTGYSAIGSGYNNQISGTAAFSVIGSGASNRIDGNADHSTIGSGQGNQISGTARNSAIGGGQSNLISGTASHSAIGSGQGNQISGTAHHSAIGGGYNNIIGGTQATIPGGYGNTAAGDYSFAAGTQAKANHTGAFVWGDSTLADFASTGNNQFLVRASGGITLYSNSAATVGAALYPGSGSWSVISDRNLKENFARVDNRDILARLAALPLQTWNYTAQSAAVRHIGPMAQDFAAAFNVGENTTTISTVDAQGVALAAIQGLAQIMADKDATIAAQQTQIDSLEARLTALEQRPSTTEQAALAANPWSVAALLLIGMMGIVLVRRSWQGGQR